MGKVMDSVSSVLMSVLEGRSLELRGAKNTQMRGS